MKKRIGTMGLIRKPKNVDFIIKSEPWTKDELKMLREIMKQQREKLTKLKAKQKNKSRSKSTNAPRNNEQILKTNVFKSERWHALGYRKTDPTSTS